MLEIKIIKILLSIEIENKFKFPFIEFIIFIIAFCITFVFSPIITPSGSLKQVISKTNLIAVSSSAATVQLIFSILTMLAGFVITATTASDIKEGYLFTLFSQPISHQEWFITKILWYVVLTAGSLSVVGLSFSFFSPIGILSLPSLLIFSALFTIHLAYTVVLLFDIIMLSKSAMATLLVTLLLGFIPLLFFPIRPENYTLQYYIWHPEAFLIDGNLMYLAVGSLALPLGIVGVLTYITFKQFKMRDVAIGRGQ